ncbi:MAG: serine hydrolase domain-containing protein [Eubacteriales bacterium]|nr:serine hydrolase domain-containing protein [Eubacteriales bacterium]
MKRKGRLIVLTAAVCTLLVIAGAMIYGNVQMHRLTGLSFSEALEYTTKNNPNAVITVGIIENGAASYKVYGENGKELPSELHTYEIGSLTKTFTAALIDKAIREGKISLNDTVDCYLSLPARDNYPSIEELLTHTSGYKGYYFQSPMAENFIKGRNDFYGITKDEVLHKIGSLDMKKDSYGFNYSNFGYSVLGLVLETVYDTDYTTLLNEFAQNELGLSSTRISDQTGDLGNCWAWKPGDAYMAAGAITSDIEDILHYARIQLEDDSYFRECHHPLKSIDASSARYRSMGINMDEIGMAWIIDDENGVVWHNGGTGDYNCYLGFKPETGDAVIILSNLSPNYRIPATVLGTKLLSEMSDYD